MMTPVRSRHQMMTSFLLIDVKLCEASRLRLHILCHKFREIKLYLEITLRASIDLKSLDPLVLGKYSSLWGM